MLTGRLEKWILSGGYGFIAVRGANESAFVHARAMKKAGITVVNIDDEYEFDIKYDQQGRPRAHNVERTAEGFGDTFDLEASGTVAYRDRVVRTGGW